MPGCVHTDLIAAGRIDDLAVSGAESAQAWVQETDWSYATTVDVSTAGAVRELVFDGLDTLATVHVDGEPVLTSSDMFSRHIIDVSRYAGQVDVRVDFRAAMPEVRRREREWGVLPRPYHVPYNYVRKMACSFGWDWGPTTATSGIWKPVRLQVWDVARFDDVDVRTSVVDGLPTVDVTARAVGDVEGLAMSVQLGESVHRAVLVGGVARLRLQDGSLALWWPRGYGEPVLHRLRVTLVAQDGAALDLDDRRVGFRSVALDTSADDEGSSFALLVNGRRVWVRGFNWIPDDLFPSRVDRARYRHRIEQALAAGANFLRVWGGGTYESDDFYDVCDELGVMVWQDFLFACAAYSEDEQTAREVTEEATQAIRRLRHRASLVLWCGGNECLEGHEHWGWPEVLGDRPWGATYYFSILPGLVDRLDGTRPYIPGSPFSPSKEADPQDSRQGTVHIWTTWGKVDYEYYEGYRPRFVAEFGYQAPASWPTLARALDVAEIDPCSPRLAAHQKALGDDKIELGLVRHFPEPVRDPVAWYFAAQLLQARAIKLGIPHFRAQYERCSGTVWWQLNDCWPALSWAVLDAAGERRLGWHAVREAYADRLVVISPLPDDLRVTFVNDADERWKATASVRHVSLRGDALAQGTAEIEIPARAAMRIDVSAVTGRRVDASVEELVLVDAPGSPRTVRASRPDRALELGAHRVRVDDVEERGDGAVVVRVTAETVLRDLSLLAELHGFGYQVDGQLATLVPGEAHLFRCRHRDRPLSMLDLGDVEDLLWSENRIRDAGRSPAHPADRSSSD